MPKKVLIITYYWPPAGGPGVQRWVKFIKYLPQFDIEPIVLIPDNPSYPILDDSLITEIDPKLRIYKSKIKEPYKVANLFSKSTKTLSSGIIKPNEKLTLIERILLFIRGNFFIPDARISWGTSALHKAEELIEKFNIQTVITTGPPHSVHLIGEKLKRNQKIHWISDFRDPWTTIGYHKKLNLLPFAKKRHQKLESLVLNSSDQLIVTSSATQKEFALKTTKPITVITNGYDYQYDYSIRKSDQFLISHIGSLLSDRNPHFLWKVLQELVDENEIFASKLKIDLYGVVAESVIESIKAFKLKQFVNLKGYVFHDDAIRAQQASQLLLLIESNTDEASVIIPGKLFEYIASRTPIIAIGPIKSDIKKIISDTNSGDYFNYLDENTLKATLKMYFKYFQDSEINSKTKNFESYSRYELTSKLSNLLK